MWHCCQMPKIFYFKQKKGKPGGLPLIKKCGMTTKLNKKAIQQAIIRYCEAKDMSQNELAIKLGINGATVSKILNNKWENISDKLWRLIDNEVSGIQADNLVITRDVQTVFRLCQLAQKRHVMAGLVADTGIGKTTAITAYSLRKNVFYYYIDATITPRVFLKDFLRLTGVDFEGSLNEMMQRLAQQLNTIENPLIVIDECAKMSDRMMLTIHSLRDRTMNNCGMVLAGMPDFKKRLKKYADKGKTGYSEFFRRINKWEELEGLTVSEINSVLVKNGITDPSEQKGYRKLVKFGDLQNEINIHLMETETIISATL